jgi:uncharacterized RDD family membrane protein YckC
MAQTEVGTHRPSSLWRRFAAIVYDAMALAAIWFFATLFVVITMKGEAVPSGNLLFAVYLLFAAFAYFGFCWTRSGQTLGMKSWHIVLLNCGPNEAITWTQAGMRFFAAIASWGIFGLGFLAALLDRENRTWHDRLSRTRLVLC